MNVFICVWMYEVNVFLRFLIVIWHWKEDVSNEQTWRASMLYSILTRKKVKNISISFQSPNEREKVLIIVLNNRITPVTIPRKDILNQKDFLINASDLISTRLIHIHIYSYPGNINVYILTHLLCVRHVMLFVVIVYGRIKNKVR